MVARDEIDLIEKKQKPETSIDRKLRFFYVCESGDGHIGTEIDVLNVVEELDAFVHGALKCLAPRDEASASGAFVDYSGSHGFGVITGA